MAEQTTGIDPQEQEEVVRIALDFFRDQTEDEDAAQELLGKLGGMVQDDGAKLVHLGNVLFLILVRGKGVVEFHTIGEEKENKDYIVDVRNLAAYLKNIGVKTAYTYLPTSSFGGILRAAKVKFKQVNAKMQNRPVKCFVMEL